MGDGYVWIVCSVCERDKFGMLSGRTLNVKFRERRMTIVGGKVSFVCTSCGGVTTIDLDASLTPATQDTLLEGASHAVDVE